MTTKATPSNSHITLMQRPFGAPRFHFDENAPPPPPPETPPPAAWHTGIDAEFIGHAQNKGWKLDDPKEAFVAATKQARELEKHFGVPPDRIVKLPAADAKPEDLRAYYERIGAPKEAKDYDLSAVKDATVAESLRATMYERGVPKDAASAVAASVAKALESKATSESAVNVQKLEEQKAALRANWGDKYDYNHLQAIEGARRLGIAPDAVKALEGVIGFDKVMDAMRKIGVGTKEDTFVERGGGGPAGDVTTREGAVARKQELMADAAWADRYLNGGAAEAREMTRINTLIDGAA
jgi:hypothetical protein